MHLAPAHRHRRAPSFQSPSPQELDRLLAAASALRLDATAGTPGRPLRGMHIGLLHEPRAGDDEATLFRAAALALGAQVAELRAGLDECCSPQQLLHMARLLGRLYDAVECQGLTEGTVRQLAAEAGVPVYDGLASSRHPTAQLVDRLDAVEAALDRRRWVVQAVLSTLA